MSNQIDLVDEIMGFDPTNLDVFKPTNEGGNENANIYRTNPKDSKSEDGVYRSRVKILLNPFSPKESIVPQAQYWVKGMDGQMPVRSSLSIGDKNCPLFKCWKRLWYSNDEDKKALSKKLFDKTESRWVLIQVLEDDNKPELVGQFKVMKLAKDIYDKLVAKMNPSSGSKNKPYPVTDYVIGLELNLEVQPGPEDPNAPERKQREISYSLSQFGDYATVIRTDGTPLLNEEEIDLVDNYVQASNEAQNGKTEAKKKAAAAKVEELRPQIVPVYKKVVEYVKDNLKGANGEPLDLVKECGYQAWDEHTSRFVSNWIAVVDAGYDPNTRSFNDLNKSVAVAEPVAETVSEDMMSQAIGSTNEITEDDIPF